MKKLDSIFDISGIKEDGIVKSFGVFLRKDKTLLKWFANKCFSNNIPISNMLFKQTEFSFEKRSKAGRTDIEIKNDLFHIVIEAKIRNSKISSQQALKYCNELNSSISPNKTFVFLTEVANIDVPKQLIQKFSKINFVVLSWNDVLELVIKRKKIQVNLINEFEDYIINTREMKIFDCDIWAVVVRGKQVINFDKHNYYLNKNRHAPVFIAKRIRHVEKGKKGKSVINELRPVIKVNDPNSKKGQSLGILKGRDFVYELGPIYKLERPMMKKNGKRFGQSSAIAINFEDLISI